MKLIKLTTILNRQSYRNRFGEECKYKKKKKKFMHVNAAKLQIAATFTCKIQRGILYLVMMSVKYKHNMSIYGSKICFHLRFLIIIGKNFTFKKKKNSKEEIEKNQ